MYNYDIIIIGAGPGGIYAAYELVKNNTNKKVAIIESGNALEKRICPALKNNTSCIHCNTCAIMQGFGGAGAFSDGKFNITTEFGGNIHEYIGKEKAVELMNYVDSINADFYPNIPKLYSTDNNSLFSECLKNDLHLLSGKLRHLGTDINYQILAKIYEYIDDNINIFFNTTVEDISIDNDIYAIHTYNPVYKSETFRAPVCIVSVGRSGSKWINKICNNLAIETSSNRVDIGVRVELPYHIFSHITDEVYESKIIYRTKQYQDLVRTFCMNPKGSVVSENTNGIITVNGHSFEDPNMQTTNTNFALLVSKHLTEPFNNSNEYGESIARLSNMLGGGVIVQRFGDLINGRRTNTKRLEESFTRPTLKATPGDLSLVMPKRFLDDIIEMIYQLDTIAPGTANSDTLLYGVEVKFYNMTVEVNNDFETKHKGLYIIGDGSGVTHSLSQAAACGIHVARKLLDN